MVFETSIVNDFYFESYRVIKEEFVIFFKGKSNQRTKQHSLLRKPTSY